MTLKAKLLWWVSPTFLLLLLYQQLLTEAYMKSVRIEEIPFGIGVPETRNNKKQADGIYATSRLQEQRGFFKLFHVPYIVCFFAAKGKWPFIPPFMQTRVDNAARTIFSKNDSYIRQFCQKWMEIKECFRPIFGTTANPIVEVDRLSGQGRPGCSCANTVAQNDAVVYFDKNYIGNVSSETILTTIEFLQSFLPPPTKKPKRKNQVRGRVDEMEID